VANIKSQLKRIKTNRVATERNKAVKSELKTWIRKFREAAEAGDADKAKDALKVARPSSTRP
jgi:small subunit ribosomal protein S20